jgi:hypothetical protein
MQRIWISALGLAALPGLAGCASSGADQTASLLTPVAASTTTASGYALSADEQDLDCKKLTGRMQIRILQIRDYNERHQASAFSRVLQSGVAAVTGGSNSGTDPDGDFSRDRAMLAAYNKQLAAKGCKTYDLDAELKPKDFRETPNPVVKPAAGAVPAKAN